MATITRPPLGKRRSLNDIVVDERGDQAKKGDSKTTKGSVEGQRKVSSRSVAELRRDITKLQERANKRSSGKDVMAPRPFTPNDSLEVKLQDLVKRHQSSKTKHLNEVTGLKEANEQLEKASKATREEAAAVKAENERLSKELDALRLTHSEQLSQMSHASDEWERHNFTEMEKLKAKVDSLKRSSSSKMLEEKTERAGEKRRLENELEIVKKENEKMIQREEAFERLEEEQEWMEDMLNFAVEECGRLNLTRIGREEHNRVRMEVERLRVKVMEKEMIERELRHDLGMCTDAVELEQSRRQEAEDGRSQAEAMLDTILEERKRDRSASKDPQLTFTEMEPLGETVDQDQLTSIQAQHTDLALLSCQAELRWTLTTLRDAVTELKSVSKQQTESQTALTTLRQKYNDTEQRCVALEAEHSKRGQQIIFLEQEVGRWQHAEQIVSAELEELKRDHRTLQQRSKGDKEVLKRANDTVMRSKSAEDAFEEEIIQLRDALDEAAQYRDLYDDLLEEYRLLVTREQLAADEVERLGAQNSELLGHGNGDQRISYVDSLRREMALTKHELASTRSQLNKANDQVVELREEVEAYKNVDLGVGLSQSTRTRVVRRVPEGSWLGSSVSASRRSTTRSVSGTGR